MTETVIAWLNEKGRDILQFLWLIVLALIMIWVGRRIIRWISKGLKRAFEKAKIESGVAGFLLKAAQVGMYLLLAMAITEAVGIGASSVIALVGSCGVAIGLALQGSLSNLAGGVLLLATKPFVAGDYIVAGTASGTVSQIDLFYTTLISPDSKQVIVPNGTLANTTIENYSELPVRRIDQTISVAYDSDIEKVKEVLLAVAKAEPHILQDKEILAFINTFGESSIEFCLRVWVPRTEFWNVSMAIREKIKEAFDANGIEIPFNQLDVKIKNEG
ncbi:MAG: mechanosensitive ion channel [Lachnospiraceae bacterium]|nr:mechanosensitive ion channel [Lachnospiraceae bacterium]